MRLPWLLTILVLLSLGCKGERQVAAVVETPRQADPRSELALARAKFEQNLIVQEQFETFDKIGSMSLGLPSSAAFYPFGESNRRFVLIQYEDHAKLLYQEIREDKPQTVWFGMMKQFAAPESSELHSLRKYLVDYGYRLTTSAIPEHVKKELIAKRGYASYALMGAVDSLVVSAIKPDGSSTASVSISPSPQSGARPLMPITPEESEWLGYGKSYFAGDGEHSITPVPEG